MKKKKLFTAILLTFVLTIVGAFPASAFAADATKIESVDISITKPVAGETLDSTPTFTTVPQSSATILDQGVQWIRIAENEYHGDLYEDDLPWQELDNGATVEAGYYYLVQVALKANSDYYFDETNLSVTLNGGRPDAVYVLGSQDEQLGVYRVFHVTNHTHSYNPDKWTTTATYHWHQCTDANCPDKDDSIKDKAKHTFKWVVDRKATADQTGIKHKVCKECGYICDENTQIAKLTSDSDSTGSDSTAASDSSPQTGDTMNIAIPLGIMLVSAAGIGITMYLRRRQYS